MEKKPSTFPYAPGLWIAWCERFALQPMARGYVRVQSMSPNGVTHRAREIEKKKNATKWRARPCRLTHKCYGTLDTEPTARMHIAHLLSQFIEMTQVIRVDLFHHYNTFLAAILGIGRPSEQRPEQRQASGRKSTRISSTYVIRMWSN